MLVPYYGSQWDFRPNPVNIEIPISLTGTMVPVSGSVRVALFCFLLPPLLPLSLSSSLGWHGAVGGHGGLSHCLWVLSVSQDLAPCMPGQSCPPVALTWHPDSHTQCTVSRLFHTINVNYRQNSIKKYSYKQYCDQKYLHFIIQQNSYVYVLTACHNSSATMLCTLTTTLLEHFVAQREWSQLLLRLHQVLDKTKDWILCFSSHTKQS